MWHAVESSHLFTRLVNPNLASLDGPLQKHRWALDHFGLLCNAVDAFRQSNPVQFTKDLDLKRQVYIFRMKPQVFMPANIGLIAGDFINNLRSCLDQLVWELATIDGVGPKNPKLTAFPVVECKTGRVMKRFHQALDGVPGPAIEAINSLQPYHRGGAAKNHPLWVLNELWNLDKHRTITTATGVFEFALPRSEGQTAEFINNEFVITIPTAHLQSDPIPTFELFFAKETFGDAVTVQQLADLFRFVMNDVMVRFKSFFGQSVDSTLPTPPVSMGNP